MSHEVSKDKAGTASVVLASCLLFVQVIFSVLVLLPERRLPGALLAVGPTIGLVSFFSLPALLLPLILGLVSLVRGGANARGACWASP
jgi:hypothetical protein